MSGFGAAWQSTDAVGYTKEVKWLVAQEAIFVFAANSANIGEGGTAELHEGIEAGS